MSESLTCGMRFMNAPDGTSIPIPVGGLGLPGGDSVDISEHADVQILINRNSDGDVVGYYVVVNNATESGSEAGHLFGELAQETAITTLEHLAAEAFTTVAPAVFWAAGLVTGVLVTLFTPSALTREVFIRCDLETENATDAPPVTFCLLLAE